MKKMLRMLIAMLALCIALCGCSAPSDGGSSDDGAAANPNEPQYGGTYIMVSGGEPLSFNPNWKTDDMALPAIYNMFNRLIKSTQDNSIVPDLAHDWEFSEDGKELTFFLRDNIKFHDGEICDADDVVWSFEKLMADGYQSGTLSNIEKVEKVDSLTVKFTLKTPDSSILSVLSWLGVWIMPEHIYNVDTDWTENPANFAPIGTGPFKFVSYEAGVSITMEAFEDYWNGRPYLDTLIISITPDAETSFQSYMNGEIDDIQGRTPKANLADLETDDRFNMFDLVGTSRTYLSFNLSEESPMSDVRVRQAVNMAIDRQGVIDRAEKGYGGVAEYYISPVFTWALNDDYKIPARDVEAAKKLIEEAGYTMNEDGFYFDCVYSIFESGSFHDTAIVVQENLKEIGINAKLEVMEIGAWMTKCIDEYDFDISMCSGGQGPDISAVRNRCHTNGSLNISRYYNPELDAALDAGITVSDEADRKVYYDEVQRILSEDLPMVVISDYAQAFPVKTYIHDHPYELPHLYSSMMMEKVWIDAEGQASFQ